MKIRLLILFLLLPLTVFADWNFPDWSCSKWSLEVRGAYFRPTSKILRESYSGEWVDYQIEGAWLVDDQVEVFAGVDWISKRKDSHDGSGYGSCDKEKRRIWILPLSLGAKYYFCLTCNLSAYLGAGVCYTFARFDSESYSCRKETNKNGLGAVLKSGLNYDWGKYTYVNFFVDYYFQKLKHTHNLVDIQRRDLDIGGYKIGAGIGVYF